MKLPIIQTGIPVLRQVARPLMLDEIGSEKIQQLIESMKEAMDAAPGVGLAAPQVGLPLQLAVIEDREEYQKEISEAQLMERERRPVPFHVIINPEVVETKGEILEFFEGCLSVQGYSAIVPRARSVRVECLNEQGKKIVIDASGWYARILQHEVDHLRGTLYIDRMLSRTFTTLDHWTQYWKGKSILEIKQSLGLK
jgi:peptide deformylase